MDAVASVPLDFGPGSSDCPKDVTMNGLIEVPDPNDCTKYTKCSIWLQVKVSCRQGKHFSPTEQKCMSPFKAGCDPSYSCCDDSSDADCTAGEKCEQT